MVRTDNRIWEIFTNCTGSPPPNQKNVDGTVVHGLTTAASLWLSAAVGVACGGELYFAATYGTAVMLVLLRFGPRLRDTPEEEEDEEDENNNELDKSLDADIGYGGVEEQSKRSERRGSETSSLLPAADRRDGKMASMRKRAHLASLV